MLQLVRWMTLMLAVTVAACAVVAAEPHGGAPLDWRQWRELPVHDSGRVMPLDTLARSLVEEICGRANPRLAPPAPSAGGTGQGSPLFPGDRPRKFTAAELLLSWLVEPERWEDIPFLAASHEGLRRDLLRVPLVDSRGRRLKYVSPRQFEQATVAHARLDELARRAEEPLDGQQPADITEADRRLEQLHRAYDAYRELAPDVQGPQRRRDVFLGRLMRVFASRRDAAQPLALWQALDQTSDVQRPVVEVNAAVRQLIDLVKKEPLSLRAAEEPVGRLCRASRSLAALAAHQRELPLDSDNAKLNEKYRELMGVLADQTAELLGRSLALRESLADARRTVRVVPSTSPMALVAQDDLGQSAQPWIARDALLAGSAAELQGYPAKKLDAVRAAFDRVRSAYLNRQAADRPKRFATAMHEFSAALRDLGETVERVRRKMLTGGKKAKDARDVAGRWDEDFLSATAYPPPGATSKEVLYNRLDPFLWAWILTLASIVAMALGFGVLRRPMFFVGAAILAAGQAFTIAGLLLRALITGMVPVTNMYETVLFAAAAVGLLGLWFALLPISAPVIAAAWRLTGMAPSPQTAASVGLSGDTARWFWRTMPLFRLLLTPVVFYVLSIGQFNPSEKGPIFPLLPMFASSTIAGLLGGFVIWLVGLVLLAWSLWFFPRAMLAAPLVVTLTPKAIWILCTQKLSRPVDQAVARGPLLLAGAIAALVGYLLAYYVPGPVFHREVGTGMAAVLRSNFWLALHVLIVTASYGAGALAWALAMISLGYYALGHYHAPKPLSPETLAAGHRPAGGYEPPESAFTHRPPAVCAKLATYIYKSIQLAVVLLAAGTITGAIWADYAWGRYWGWDPKEVWALISLLVYLAVLHGRWAGWTGNFGIAVGAVLGAVAILMTWYGVNFLIKGGLHSYGQSSGGESYVVTAVLANLLLVAFAMVRYQIERHSAAAKKP